jgi:hypothetical protein
MKTADMLKLCKINKDMLKRIQTSAQELVDTEEFVADVVRGVHRNAIVYGPPGLGKTHIVESALKAQGKQVGVDYLVARSHITPRSLYAMLYCMRNKDQYVVIDDCDGVLSSEDGLNILKAATDPTFRNVGWSTTAASVKLPNGDLVPDEFEFNGTLIICTNVRQAMRGKVGQHFTALKSRCPGWSLNFATVHDQFAYIVHLIVDRKYLDSANETKLTDKQKIDLISFMYSNLDVVQRLDLRKPQHIAKVIKHKPNWHNHALKFLTEVM